MHSIHTCPSSRARWLTCFTALCLASSACALTGIDPDEIDVANDEASGQEDLGSESGPIDTAAEEGTSTGDGDGDQDTTAATDASSAGSTTSDASDSGEMLVCEALDELALGDNPVESPDVPSLIEGSCGGANGESIYSFLAAVAGDYTFAITAGDIPALIYAVDAQCVPIDGACATGADGLVVGLDAGETLLIVVDSDSGSGAATLTITGP